MDLETAVNEVSATYSKRGARRDFLEDLLNDLEKQIACYAKILAKDNVDDLFYRRFRRNIIRWLMADYDLCGSVTPWQAMPPMTDGAIDTFSWDFVSEWIWPRIQIALCRDQQEMEAFLLRLVKRLTEKELVRVTNEIAARF